MQSETKLTGRLVSAWRKMGGQVLNVHGNRYQQSGWPDVFVCHHTWTGWIEFKVTGGKLSAKQTYLLKELEKNENAWCVRIVDQTNDCWLFTVERYNHTVEATLTLNGTDGQVAATLLKKLRGLDGE